MHIHAVDIDIAAIVIGTVLPDGHCCDVSHSVTTTTGARFCILCCPP